MRVALLVGFSAGVIFQRFGELELLFFAYVYRKSRFFGPASKQQVPESDPRREVRREV